MLFIQQLYTVYYTLNACIWCFSTFSVVKDVELNIEEGRARELVLSINNNSKTSSRFNFCLGLLQFFFSAKKHQVGSIPMIDSLPHLTKLQYLWLIAQLLASTALSMANSYSRAFLKTRHCLSYRLGQKKASNINDCSFPWAKTVERSAPHNI